MHGDTVIDVRNLTKTYRLYRSPMDRVKEVFHPRRKRYHTAFDALRGVSFTVEAGETVGVIGRNGSGKSTLLQLICGILEPSRGSVSVAGRVTALLELGAGFTPEFTGRQNVYLNGAIMGFKAEEMEQRMEAIAAFAEIGGFLDQPVKTYSSGMFVRLAFSVAISVDPDILIVDEALAVGDEIFQRKCFSRLQQFREMGKTIVFVSHSAQAVVELCNRAFLLDQGELILEGPPKYVVSRYHKLIFAPAHKLADVRSEIASGAPQGCQAPSAPACPAPAAEEEAQPFTAWYDPDLVPRSTVPYESFGAEITDVHLTTPEGDLVNVLLPRGEYVYTYRVRFLKTSYQVRFGMMIRTVSGLDLGGAASATLYDALPCIDAGTLAVVRFRFKCLLYPGVYFLNAGTTSVVDGCDVFLHRIVDVAMIRVQYDSRTRVTGTIDFCIDADVNFEYE